MNIRFLLIATIVALPFFWATADAPNARLNDSVIADVDRLVRLSRSGQPVTLENLDPLYRAAVLRDGDVQPLMAWLSLQRGDAAGAKARALAEIEVHVAARRGDLQHASDVLNKLLKMEKVAAERLDLRIWQARLFDALGEVDRAKATYQSLLEEDLSESDQQMVRLRLALMGLLGTETQNAKADAKELIELAKSSQDIPFRNRASIVLAVQNQYSEAIKLFTIQGEGTERFRSASRFAEWAIHAGDRDRAIESSWDAAGSSELKRDRRYALALLVESYRMKAKSTPAPKPKEGESKDAANAAAPKYKPGLEALIEAFEEEEGDEKPLHQEMREVWVDLLRELGRHDDAIALFKSSSQGDSGFTIEMRRELLEMEGDAGNIDRLIASYRELIDAEPEQLVWRGGLTRLLLEQGQDKEAADLWATYIDSLTKGSQLLASAQTLGGVGLDDLAAQCVERMVSLKADHGQGLLYLADLQQRRGRVGQAEETLMRIADMPDVGDAVRSELAGAFERVGRQDKAIEVIEAIRAARETVAEDVEMRLAWLYSEVGDEEKALQQWLALWRKITSVPRRRYVEDRLMTVASRLGTLADIAIELEEKLADQNADDREAGLLVRIYSRVNDSVAASEILEEYMSQTGRNEVERLQEKGRIYQVCHDYWNYEKVIERLIEIDPEGTTEYLRQLALSMLERGKAQEARRVLLDLRDADDGRDSIGGEFEAGVLSLVGMNREAADAYRRGIATYPDRIESYLLLANLLKEMGETERAVGMFQYLAENADRDDLFTIAIDGLLNMEAKGKVMQWARRITLQRLAGREDKNYLYQLLADLSSEVNDKTGQIRALENSLAVSGTRRLSVLRECMDLSSRIRGGVFYSTSSRGPTNAGNKPFFAFGRRLIGLGELMPPQVFLDLGQAFLADGDVDSAERTFGLARNLADERAYQREVAEIFEKGGKQAEALVRYDRLLRTSPSDVALMARVAKLNEQEGHDDVAFRFYLRGLNLLIDQTPLTTREDTSKNNSGWSWGGNRDAYQTYVDRLLRGLLVTADDGSVDEWLQDQRSRLDQNLKELRRRSSEGRGAALLSDSPRIEKQSDALQKMYYAFDCIHDLETMQRELIRTFDSDKKLLEKFAADRISRGRYDSAGRLMDGDLPSDDQRKRLATMLGHTDSRLQTSQPLAPAEMWRRFLPHWMAGEKEQARNILRRVDQSKGTSSSGSVVYTVVNGVLVPRTTGSGANVSSWMRMALHLGDRGLALQFARSRLAQSGRYGSSGIKRLFDGYRGILPDDSFRSLARYAANLYKDDKNRIAEYLWIITQLRDDLGEDLPSDEQLLEKVEESDLALGYQFPFSLAIETFPESIRGEAMAHVVDAIEKKSRPRELMRIPFRHNAPIDQATAKAILDAIASGIQPALQDDYLKYAVYYLPRSGTALQNPENKDVAIAALDLLSSDEIQKRDRRIASIAQYIKAVVLHQSGQTEQALEIVLPRYDPEETISDYYHRYARDWATRELIAVAPLRFLEAMEEDSETSKRTVTQTDQRLAIIKRSGDEQLLQQAYEQAMKDHPDQTKYVAQYEQWHQRAGRIGAAIDINLRSLARLPDDDAGQAKAKPIRRRLAELWFSVNHRVNGLPHWLPGDEEDRQKFAEEVKAREKKKADQEKANQTAQKSPAKEDAESEKPEKKKEYSQSIAGVKSALGDEDPEAAAGALRGVWRAFPGVVESPYGYRSGRKRINGLTWPSDPKPKTNTPPAEPSESQRREAQQQQWANLRGGLATFAVQPTKTERKKPQSAWKVLAREPFGVAEMRRILRSRTPAELTGVSDVVLGLLEADRIDQGDQAIFDSLVQKLQGGRSSTVELTQFFAMLEEDPSRINEQNESVMDVLLQQLDLTQLKMANQLAKVCGMIGQRRRAAALYTHCALLAPSQGVTFMGLIGQARESFEGQELIDLAEQMFAVTRQDEASVAGMLDLRMELLQPDEVAKRSAVLFVELDDDPRAYPITRAIRGAVLFAEAGQYDRASQCLHCALLRHGRPKTSSTSSSYYYYGTARPALVSRQDLKRVFPEDARRFVDYAAWLSAASEANRKLIESGELKPDIAVESQTIIALRQCQNDQRLSARKSLACIPTELVAEAKKHELLVIDVMRESGMNAEALQIESWLFENEKLSHVRLGDLLRDKRIVEGDIEAIQWADELLSRSLDEDLVLAAAELMSLDPDYDDRVATIIQKRQAAESEYQQRTEAANDRKKTRNQWKVSSQ